MNIQSVLTATALLASSACFQINASGTPCNLNGAAYFISNETLYDDAPVTMMQSYSISLPCDLSEAQKKSLVEKVSEIMAVKPGKESKLEMSEVSFIPMNSDQVNKYSLLYNNDETEMNNWYLKTEVKPFETRIGVIAMQIANSMYFGGAHGGLFIGYVNYNPVTDKVVKLEDYVKTKAGKTALKNLLYTEAKRRLGDMLTLKASEFFIPSQYRITDDGITFVYQEYEIGPYAIGIPEFNISFSTLKGLDSPKTIAPKRKTTKNGKSPMRKIRRK